jgi:hypothetical protein
MNERENACAHHGKNRHSFCRSVNGCSPLLAEKEEDGGDQRSSMTDSDPKNEIRDIPGPADSFI